MHETTLATTTTAQNQLQNRQADVSFNEGKVSGLSLVAIVFGQESWFLHLDLCVSDQSLSQILRRTRFSTRNAQFRLFADCRGLLS
jgi:hypothetical protein